MLTDLCFRGMSSVDPAPHLWIRGRIRMLALPCGEALGGFLSNMWEQGHKGMVIETLWTIPMANKIGWMSYPYGLHGSMDLVRYLQFATDFILIAFFKNLNIKWSLYSNFYPFLFPSLWNCDRIKKELSSESLIITFVNLGKKFCISRLQFSFM